MNIADAKTKYFTDKEHYLAFRQAWSEAVNNPDIHLQAEHFMFYSAIRGRNILEGFKEVTSKKRLYNQRWINLRAYETRHNLTHLLLGRMWGMTGEEFIKIFNGTLSYDTLRHVIQVMPEVKMKIDSSMFHQGPSGKHLSFEEWVIEHQLKQFGEKLATQTPVEPEFREALSQMKGELL